MSMLLSGVVVVAAAMSILISVVVVAEAVGGSTVEAPVVLRPCDLQICIVVLSKASELPIVAMVV